MADDIGRAALKADSVARYGDDFARVIDELPPSVLSGVDNLPSRLASGAYLDDLESAMDNLPGGITVNNFDVTLNVGGDLADQTRIVDDIAEKGIKGGGVETAIAEAPPGKFRDGLISNADEFDGAARQDALTQQLDTASRSDEVAKASKGVPGKYLVVGLSLSGLALYGLITGDNPITDIGNALANAAKAAIGAMVALAEALLKPIKSILAKVGQVIGYILAAMAGIGLLVGLGYLIDWAIKKNKKKST